MVCCWEDFLGWSSARSIDAANCFGAAVAWRMAATCNGCWLRAACVALGACSRDMLGIEMNDLTQIDLEQGLRRSRWPQWS